MHETRDLLRELLLLLDVCLSEHDAAGRLYTLIVSVHADDLPNRTLLLYGQQVFLQLQDGLIEDDPLDLSLCSHHVRGRAGLDPLARRLFGGLLAALEYQAAGRVCAAHAFSVQVYFLRLRVLVDQLN